MRPIPATVDLLAPLATRYDFRLNLFEGYEKILTISAERCESVQGIIETRKKIFTAPKAAEQFKTRKILPQKTTLRLVNLSGHGLNCYNLTSPKPGFLKGYCYFIFG